VILIFTLKIIGVDSLQRKNENARPKRKRTKKLNDPIARFWAFLICLSTSQQVAGARR